MTQHFFKRNINIAICAIIISILSALTATVLVIIWATKKDVSNGYLGGLNYDDSIFNWHPILMVLSFSLCFLLGILSFRIDRNLLDRNHKKCLHLILMFIALIGGSIGIYTAYKSHQVPTDDNLYYGNLDTLHSWIGLGAIIAFAQNAILGVLYFVMPLFTISVKTDYKKFHIIFGISSFVLVLLANVTGIMEMNTWNECTYFTTNIDNDPSQNYNKLAEGCHLSNWIALLLILSTLMCLIGIGYFQKYEEMKFMLKENENTLQEPLLQ